MNTHSSIAGVGVDIMELRRVSGVCPLKRFAEYFLRPHELAAFRRNADLVAFTASRFALKEAVILKLRMERKIRQF